MPASAPFAAPLALACLLGPALAQDTEDPNPIDPSIEMSESTRQAFALAHARSLPIALDAALTLAETNNLGLLIEDISTEVAQFNALGAWGAFDWILGAEARFTSVEQENPFIFQGASQTDEMDQYQLSLSRALETGGSFNAMFSAGRTNTTSVVAESETYTADTLSLSFSQPLLRGAGTDRGTADQRESEVTYLQQIEHRRQVLQQLLLDTSNAYWGLVQARRQVEVAESSLDLGREQLDRNRRLLDAGVGTEVEVIQAEAEVARRLEVLLLAKVNQATAGDALKSLLFPGKDPDSWNTLLIPTTTVPEDVSVEGLPPWMDVLEVANVNRPELRQQQLAVRLAQIRHERAVSDRRIGLDLDLGLSSRGLDTEFDNSANEALQFDYLTYTAGLVLNAPLQNRTAAFAERAARAQLRAAKIGFEQTETLVVSEVRGAVRQLHYESLAVHAAEESLRAATRQLDAEVARYENDLSTNFQVLEFQLQLVEAMNSELTARVSYAKALHQLDAAQGILGEGR